MSESKKAKEFRLKMKIFYTGDEVKFTYVSGFGDRESPLPPPPPYYGKVVKLSGYDVLWVKINNTKLSGFVHFLDVLEIV